MGLIVGRVHELRFIKNNKTSLIVYLKFDLDLIFYLLNFQCTLLFYLNAHSYLNLLEVASPSKISSTSLRDCCPLAFFDALSCKGRAYKKKHSFFVGVATLIKDGGGDFSFLRSLTTRPLGWKH